MASLERFTQLAPNIVVGVWQNDKELCKSGNADHYIRIGSITKMFTAIAIKRLMSEGKLNLRDSANKYLNLNIPPEVTIEHLTTMTSGLPDYTSDSTFLASCMVNPEMKWNPEQLVAIAMKNQVTSKPGEKWSYCNANYIILGLILEKITGKSLEEVYQEYIFKPFQMNSTYLPTTPDLPEPHFEGFQYMKDQITNVTRCHPSMAWASGGVISTLNDLYKFARKLITGNLISFERCRTSPNNYGFGIMKLGNFFGHNGNFPGYQGFLGVNPNNQTIIIVLTNLKQTLDGKPPADNVAYDIMKELQQ